MSQNPYQIAVISDQKPRTEVLCDIIQSGFGYIQNISVLTSANLECLQSYSQTLILVIDLIGINKRSDQIITPLMESYSNLKIIALHIYKSPKLIQPLYKMGIHGYVYYEPSREELVSAIEKVTDGEIYKPTYLRTA